MRISSAHPRQSSRQQLQQPPPVIVQEATSSDLQVLLLHARVLLAYISDTLLCYQHIHQVPGLNRVTMAVVVEMTLAAGIPYHQLPSPPASDQALPPLLLSVTADALALLLALDSDVCDDSGSAGRGLASGCRRITALLPPLLHVCASAAAGRARIVPPNIGWWQPCALHVHVEGDDDAVSVGGARDTSAWHAAISLLQHAASEWPLVTVRLRFKMQSPAPENHFSVVFEGRLLPQR